MNKKWLTALALSGFLLAGGSAFAMEPTINVDSSTANMPNKAESHLLKVNVVTPEIKQISGVVYEQVPSRGYENVAMKMDILKPQSKTPLPAIVYVTGGGFINANKDNGIQLRMHLAEAGYVVASIEYRVAPTAVFPQPLEDVKASIRYLRANAKKFNIDPDRIGIVGGSAGGYLTAMAGVTSGTTTFDKGENLDQSSSVKAAVDLYGLSDLTRIGDDYSDAVKEAHKSAGATEALWVNGSPVFGGRDGGILADPAAAKAADPMTYVGKNSAPMLLMHGTKDFVVSPSQTDLLFQVLRKEGIPSDRYLVEGAAHGGVYWDQAEALSIITDFFNKYLK
ncbi:alpha/beta hydrolase fold domain-containing protein [Dialister hominis]|uniref:alpha/beta hydrolase fold domain-containing protein n=1 Tax=Dialister hominis TaxID=2582419 RepID=UPI003FD78413